MAGPGAAAHAAGAAGQAPTVANAFESAQAATIEPLMVAANRNALVRMVLSNRLGLNAPAGFNKGNLRSGFGNP